MRKKLVLHEKPDPNVFYVDKESACSLMRELRLALLFLANPNNSPL